MQMIFPRTSILFVNTLNSQLPDFPICSHICEIIDVLCLEYWAKAISRTVIPLLLAVPVFHVSMP